MPGSLAARVVLAIAITPSILGAQTAAAGSHSAGGPSAFLNSLSADAQRADSPAGDLNYATELIRMTASRVSPGDATQLAHRLASADQAARHDTSKYVPETAVVAAFNGLMAKAQGSNAKPIRTEVQTVHRIRLFMAAYSPALSSVKEHPASCLPDEAVLLLFQLKFNNGRIGFVPSGQPAPAIGTTENVGDAADDAGLRLDQYLAAHSAAANATIFNELLQNMGI
jgi:hypothetical protein